MRHSLTLDISPCGKGWCGIEVRDGKCAATALGMTASQTQEQAASFDGHLALADRGRPFGISATLYVRDGAMRLQFLGNPATSSSCGAAGTRSTS